MPPPIGIRVAAKIRASASTIKRKFGFAGKKTRGKKKKSKDKKKKAMYKAGKTVFKNCPKCKTKQACATAKKCLAKVYA